MPRRRYGWTTTLKHARMVLALDAAVRAGLDVHEEVRPAPLDVEWASAKVEERRELEAQLVARGVDPARVGLLLDGPS
jgi:hypothetical protein